MADLKTFDIETFCAFFEEPLKDFIACVRLTDEAKRSIEQGAQTDNAVYIGTFPGYVKYSVYINGWQLEVRDLFEDYETVTQDEVEEPDFPGVWMKDGFVVGYESTYYLFNKVVEDNCLYSAKLVELFFNKIHSMVESVEEFRLLRYTDPFVVDGLFDLAYGIVDEQGKIFSVYQLEDDEVFSVLPEYYTKLYGEPKNQTLKDLLTFTKERYERKAREHSRGIVLEDAIADEIRYNTRKIND